MFGARDVQEQRTGRDSARRREQRRELRELDFSVAPGPECGIYHVLV